MWKAIAAQATDGEFGNPDAFCSDIEATNWMSATVATSDDEVIEHIMNICKRDPRAGKVTTGGIVTVKDSTENWYLSWTINRQPQFREQDRSTVLVWLYSLNTNKEGNYVKKAMRDCTGEEVCREWLYHIGVPEDRIDTLAKNACNTTTCFMPYINAFFQPRKESDRPKVVPDAPSTSRSSVSLPKRPATLFSPPNTPCVPVWNRSTRFLMLTAVYPRSGEANTMSESC